MKIKEKDIITIKNKTVSGMSLLLVREVAMKGLAILGQFFLIRLLLPEYFGLFAILTFIQTSAELFTDIGFSQAIIQKKEKITPHELASIFYTKMTLSLILFSILFFLAPFLITLFFRANDQIILMLRVLAVIMLIKPYRTTITALLERDLSYNFISFVDLSGIVTYYLVAIILAIQGFQIWSLILALVAKELLEMLLTIFVKRWFPVFSFQWKPLKDILHFGAYLQIGTVLSYVSQSTIPVLGGKMMSTQSVGFLNFSSNISLIPNVLIENFGRVAFSGFSRIQHDLSLLGHAITKSIRLLNVIIFLFIVVIFGFSHDLVSFFFTEKWLPAVPALYWFVASTYFAGGNVTMGHALLAIGKSKEVFFVSILTIIVQWLFPILLIPSFGFTAVAFGMFSGVVILFYGYAYLLRKNTITVSLHKTYLNSSILLIITLIFAHILNTLLYGDIVIVILKVILSIIFYLFLGMLLTKNEIKQILTLCLSATKLRK